MFDQVEMDHLVPIVSGCLNLLPRDKLEFSYSRCFLKAFSGGLFELLFHGSKVI